MHDRTNQPPTRVLYLVHRFPYPPDKGDRIRAFHIIDFLRTRCDLTVVTIDDSGASATDNKTLAKHCQRLEVVPSRPGRTARGLWNLARGGSATIGAFRSRQFAQTVARIAGETTPDAVLLSTSGLAELLAIPELQGVRRVVDFVDLDSQKWGDYAAQTKWPLRPVYEAESRRLRAVESRLVRSTDAITLVSEAERRLCEEQCGPGPIHAVTNGVRPGPTPAKWPERNALVFVGALDYEPNVAGVHWFCEHVWPRLVARHPELVLRLVGRAPRRSIRNLRIPGVEVVGPVPQVRPYLDEATISISPLRIARGLQNKVLEAMAAGRAVVTSSGAAEGIMATPGRDLLVADSPVEWEAAVCRLLDDRALAQRLGQAGRDYIEESHDWATCLSELPALLGLESAGVGNRESGIGFRESCLVGSSELE